MLMVRFGPSVLGLVVCIVGATFGQKVELPPALTPESDGAIRTAVDDYIRELEEIDRRAAEARMAAKRRLLAVLGRKSAGAGLIGTATVNGEQASVAFHYQHGRVLPGDVIRERFRDGDGPQTSVTITLVGYVEAPREMTVRVWHAAGGVSEDWGELYIDDRLLGRVGDDLAKKEIHTIELKPGKHHVRWVLTGGYFRNNLLRFEDAMTGDLLSVSHDSAQRRETGADRAGEVVFGNADPDTWPEAADRRQWHEQPPDESSLDGER